MPRKQDALADLKRYSAQQAREDAQTQAHALKLARIAEIAAVKLHAKLQERAAISSLALQSRAKRGATALRGTRWIPVADLVRMRDGLNCDDRILRAIGIFARLLGCALIVFLMYAWESC